MFSVRIHVKNIGIVPRGVRASDLPNWSLGFAMRLNRMQNACDRLLARNGRRMHNKNGVELRQAERRTMLPVDRISERKQTNFRRCIDMDEGIIYGYVRVSMKQQNEVSQVIAMREFGVADKRIYLR